MRFMYYNNPCIHIRKRIYIYMYVRVYVHVIVSDEITFGRAHSVFKVRNSAIECIYWCRSGI